MDDTLLDFDSTALLVVANPDDTIGTKSTNTHTEDTTQNRVSSRDGHTDTSSESEVARRSNDGADHTKHEESRLVVKSLDIDNLGSDGVGNTATDTEGTTKLHDGGTQHGLDIGNGAGGDGAGPRVGDIVRTNVPGVEEGKDCAYREEVVVLVEGRHLG